MGRRTGNFEVNKVNKVNEFSRAIVLKPTLLFTVLKLSFSPYGDLPSLPSLPSLPEEVSRK